MSSASRRVVGFDAHPPVQQQTHQPIARFAAERFGRIDRVTDLRRIDAEQAHASEVRDHDRVAVDDLLDEYMISSADTARERRGLKKCGGGHEQNVQKLHTRLLVA
jgi:hypothetical protein